MLSSCPHETDGAGDGAPEWVGRALVRGDVGGAVARADRGALAAAVALVHGRAR